MSSVGVYINTYNNPKNLRLAVLQILNQTTKPDVLVIHQNNHSQDYFWVLKDVLNKLEKENISVHNIHNPDVGEDSKEYYKIAVKTLYDLGVDIFIKWDDDDIYYENYIETVLENLKFADSTVFKFGEKLVLNSTYEYQHDSNFDFAWIHCLGGMSPTLSFKRHVAEKVLELWEKDYSHYDEKMWEDKILCYELYNTNFKETETYDTTSSFPSMYINKNDIVACYVTDFTNRTAYVEILKGWFKDIHKLEEFFNIIFNNVDKKIIRNIYEKFN